MNTLLMSIIILLTNISEASNVFNSDCTRTGHQAEFVAKVNQIQKIKIDQVYADCYYNLKDFEHFQPNQICRLDKEDLQDYWIEDVNCTAHLKQNQRVSGILIRRPTSNGFYYQVENLWSAPVLDEEKKTSCDETGFKVEISARATFVKKELTDPYHSERLDCSYGLKDLKGLNQDRLCPMSQQILNEARIEDATCSVKENDSIKGKLVYINGRYILE